MTYTSLGEFEHLLLLAILRLGADAYAPALLAELASHTGRPASAGSVYVTLDRLEAKGFIRSRLGAPVPDRGGRPRRFVTVTPHGIRQLSASRQELLNLWSGLEGLLERQ